MNWPDHTLTGQASKPAEQYKGLGDSKLGKGGMNVLRAGGRPSGFKAQRRKIKV